MVDRTLGMTGTLVAFLTLGLLVSCSSSRTKPNSQIKATSGSTVEAPNQRQRTDEFTSPEIVQAEGVRIENGVKMLTVGNAQSHYYLSCDTNLDSCVTPTPGKDYLLFTKTTRWRFPGAKDFVTLEWIQSWSGSYNNEENIALLPQDGHRNGWGVYWLRSWNKNK